MRRVQQLCAACVLTLAIALSAFAGNMEAGIVAPPTPQGNMSTTVASNMETGDIDTATAMEVALSLLQSLLSLF